MAVRIITDGKDQLTRPCLTYLTHTYGIPDHHIRHIRLDSPVGAPQTITVTLLVQDGPQGCACTHPFGCKHRGGTDYAGEPAAVRIARPGDGPTGDGDRDLADTAILPMPESHAPTTCTYAWDTSTLNEPGKALVCGELIRWSEANGWHHVIDRQLGVSAHPATPGPVAPGRPHDAR